MSAQQGSVIILHESLPDDARPDELDTLQQVREISAALEAIGWHARSFGVDLDLRKTMSTLQAGDADLVFNLVESLGGCGQLIAVVPSILSAAGLRHTGSGADAIYLSSQKVMAKRWMMLHGIPTPSWVTANGNVGTDGRRWIVKSVWEHASLGIDDESVVRGKRAILNRLESRREQFGGEWFAERYIEGREFNISLIEEDGDPRVLPIAEISFDDYAADRPRIVGYAAKWDTQSFEYHGTPRRFPKLSPQQDERIRGTAIKCWRLFGIRGYARVDIRLDHRGVPWVLEVNANPCLTQDAGFVAAAREAGMTYEDVVNAVIAAAFRPDRRQPRITSQV